MAFLQGPFHSAHWPLCNLLFAICYLSFVICNFHLGHIHAHNHVDVSHSLRNKRTKKRYSVSPGRPPAKAEQITIMQRTSCKNLYRTRENISMSLIIATPVLKLRHLHRQSRDPVHCSAALPWP